MPAMMPKEIDTSTTDGKGHRKAGTGDAAKEAGQKTHDQANLRPRRTKLA